MKCPSLYKYFSFCLNSTLILLVSSIPAWSQDTANSKTKPVDATAKATSTITGKSAADAIAFINKHKTGYLATIDGSKPRVRAWGILSCEEGKLFFATSNTKPVFDQMIKNPTAEWVCSDSTFNETVRVFGHVVLITSKEKKQKALEQEPRLKRLYGGKDGEAFEMFYLTIDEVNWFSRSKH